MSTFVPVNVHLTINMQDLGTWLSSSCPLTDVLKGIAARGPHKALTCVYVCMSEREKDGETERAREREYE